MEEIKAYKCGYCGKLYQQNLPENVRVALDDNGWEAMPTHAEGCKYAKKYRQDKEWLRK